MTLEEILNELHALANPTNVAGMRRFGINPQGTLGISIPELRRIARQMGQEDREARSASGAVPSLHALAGGLWESGIHEARLLASFVDDPRQVDEAQMERWAADFDSWDVCDQVCSNLFDRTPWVVEKAVEWSGREQEFVKRAGFVLMASLAVHDKQAGDELFESFLPLIVREASDERNYVRKAVNWALRQIGKRNATLRQRALETCRVLLESGSRSARWIASDAVRELQNAYPRKDRGHAIYP